MSTSFPWARLDAAIRHDPGERGVALIERPNPLEVACRALAAARSVLVVTGFLHLGTGEPETDGIGGSLALGRALEALDKDVHWLTDAACRVPLEELGAVPLIVPDFEGLDPGGVRERLEQVLELTGADAAVFIERPGRGRDGRYLNVRGEPIPAAPLDELLAMAGERDLVTVAVGDGGNEAGMGALAPDVLALLEPGPAACVLAADHLVVAGISDWGAYALVTGLGWVTGHSLMPTSEEVEGAMQTMLEVGAVDGVTGDQAWTLDGVPFEETVGLVKELGLLTAN